mgnify:CR=1 FL=1|jgi:hypothetical protein
MEYGFFKALQGLLFFGVAFGFGFWQLYVLRRDSRGEDEKRDG